ncbi:glycosyltransferase family 1 protein [Niabella terrae]
MKYPHTGLYHFCKELGDALLRQQPEDSRISFYVPEQKQNVFGSRQDYIIQNSLHKVWPRNHSKYDLWHCTFQGTNYLPARRHGLKILTTIHDLNFLHESKSRKKETKYLKKIQELIHRSDHIVTISNFVRNQILEYLNIEPEKISVIYNGTNMPKSSRLQRPQELNDHPFFFSIGTITDKKNFHVLPAMLLNNDYHLVIAGVTQSQSYRNQIIEEAARLGVSERVKLIGPVSDCEKFWLYQHCAAFCFPSLAEGFGLPVVEAMQFGTPVILSKATSLPEVGGPHALYYNDTDTENINMAAENFLNQEITQEKRNHLKKQAGRFRWDIAAKKYCELYGKM